MIPLLVVAADAAFVSVDSHILHIWQLNVLIDSKGRQICITIRYMQTELRPRNRQQYQLDRQPLTVLFTLIGNSRSTATFHST